MKKTLFMYFIIFVTLFGSLAIASAMDMDSQDNTKLKETWISISGTVVNPKPAEFTLNYGDGTIAVDMQDWKWYKKNNSEMSGDKVTVYGILDETLFDGKSIDATSIYDQKLGKYFFGRNRELAMDQRNLNLEDPLFQYWGSEPILVGGVTVKGTVTGVNGRVFTINAGAKKVTVDTSSMPYDPLDKKGYQMIDKGDYLTVTGHISDAFMTKGELVADHIVVLTEEK